ncbi:MAG: hypothetical protein J5956_11650 [Ruminococcus sp.]|nr:hypothetical protein [Ruminococcus sp.]
MAKENHLLKKMATVLGLFAIAIFIIGAASSNDNRNDGDALIEAVPPATVTTATAPATPVVDNFSFNAVDETVEADGKILPVEVKKTLVNEGGVAKFTAKAIIGDKTVLLSGELPTTVLEPIICEFKTATGTQVTKFDNGFVAATIIE